MTYDFRPGIPVTLPSEVAVGLPAFDWRTLGIGTCAVCGRAHERFGRAGTPLCMACRPAVSQEPD